MEYRRGGIARESQQAAEPARGIVSEGTPAPRIEVIV